MQRTEGNYSLRLLIGVRLFILLAGEMERRLTFVAQLVLDGLSSHEDVEENIEFFKVGPAPVHKTLQLISPHCVLLG